MYSRILCIRLFAGLFFAVLLSLNLSAQKLDHVQGELLIVLEDGVDIQQLLPEFGHFENKRTKAITTKLKTAPIPLWKLRFDHNQTHEIRYLDKVRSMRGVQMAQFNHLIEYRNIPDDPQFPNQWQYLNDGINGAVADADIDMDLAWDITTGGLTYNGDTIVACVIDGGMDPSHQDFGDNLWKNWAEIPDNDIDDDNNGYVDDFNGWSAYDDNDNVFIGGSHGTPVAGIIGAQGNNGIGVSGVNWDVKVMIVRGGGNEAAALEAYAYPYTLRKRYNETMGEEGAFVVVTNASWGTDLLHWEDAPIWCSFYDSLGVQGILSCGATANANYNIDEQGDMPTSCPSDYLITVTNMASDDKKVSGAGYGIETIDLGAFGAGTWTTALNNNYSGFGGTSGATPHVSGSVALAYSVSCDILADLAMENPGQSALLIKEFILNGVKPNESLEGKTLTGGKLNVNNSLLLLQNFCGDCPFPVNVNIKNLGLQSASLSWSVSVDSMFFDVVFREKGEMDWDTLYNVQSPLEFQDLSSCTQYEFKIKTRCLDDQGTYSFIYNFETDGCCILPPGHSLDWQDDSLLIILEDILATDTYTLEYKLFGSTDWETVTQDNNVFTLPVPGDCKIYQFRYGSVCGNQDIEFSDLFQTDSDCEDCAENQLCEVSANNYFEYIDTVQIASFTNVSGRDNDSYGNYTFALATELDAGETYRFRMVPGFNENIFDEYVQLYADFNLNGSFESK
jgi:serine protease